MKNSKGFKAGCDKCERGYIAHKKKSGAFGFDYAPCDCLLEAERLNTIIRHTRYSNIPKRFLEECTIKDWTPQKPINLPLFKKLLGAKKKNWLFLGGEAGKGKTYSAIILGKTALLNNMSVFFSPTTDFLHNMRAMQTNEDIARHTEAMARTVDVLILDDIGQEKASQWVREKLYSIINYRWSNGKMTVFTSNYQMQNLIETVSNAVYSRIKGESIEVIITEGKDKRIYT